MPAPDHRAPDFEEERMPRLAKWVIGGLLAIPAIVFAGNCRHINRREEAFNEVCGQFPNEPTCKTESPGLDFLNRLDPSRCFTDQRYNTWEEASHATARRALRECFGADGTVDAEEFLKRLREDRDYVEQVLATCPPMQEGYYPRRCLAAEAAKQGFYAGDPE